MTSPFPSSEVIVRTGKTYAKDLTERVLWTGATAVGGVLIAAGPADMLHVSFWKSVGVAGIIAAGTLLKGLAARMFGDPNSASTVKGV
ncbi:hypothetical protein OTB20_32230 [Streptomyces sp. H27-H1]|uniref:hypothetical protein n=1 Tax=Streptomyces sp. H27-H1 TaxID=2996461 RepID=UPI002271D435|nr:hypothetical protein [Streptomyces sp. H27-H1]MCY0930777.1 hypothetical protein [Streptomyces sp. H27-H1]